MRISRRLVGFSGLMVVLALVAWIWAGQWLSQRSANRYKVQLRAAGEKLTIAELAPPPLLPESNSAALLAPLSMNLNSQSEALLNRDPPVPMHLLAPGKAEVAWRRPYPGEQQTNSWSDLEAALASESEILKGLRQLVDCPSFNFNLDYRQGPWLLLPHLAPLKRTGQRFSASAILNLHNGDPEAAATDIRAMLAVVKGMASEPLPISQLVRIAVAHIAFATTWELLQATNVPQSQLAALQNDWTEIDFARSAEKALAMERAINDLTIERMRESNAEFAKIIGLGSSSGAPPGNSPGDFLREIFVASRQIQWRLSWSYADQVKALEGDQVLIEAMRQAASEHKFLPALRRQEERLKAFEILGSDPERMMFGSDDLDLRHLFSSQVFALRKCLKRVLLAEVARQLAITAIGLNRYRLRMGAYPSELSALAPDFLPVTPLDPVDGQPLRYRLNPDGSFILYSVGEDGIDDGGDLSPKARTVQSKSRSWAEGWDLVWPEPAS